MSKKNLSAIEKEIEDLELEEKKIRVRQEQIATSLYELKKKKIKLKAGISISIGDMFIYEDSDGGFDIFKVLEEQSKGVYKGKYFSVNNALDQISISVSNGYCIAEKLIDGKYRKIALTEFNKLFHSISTTALEKFK